MNILAIGNSFSEDATTYLHDVLCAAGVEATVVNLYIGGCSFERHWANVLEGKADYMYQLNGVHTERMVDIDTVLREREWDYIISQQCSHYSGIPETYVHFADRLYEHAAELAPGAELLVMQTWAYEHGSTHPHFPTYEHNQTLMYEKLCSAYGILERRLNLRRIPCGDVVQLVRENDCFNVLRGGMSICRDGYHMHYIYGRFLTAMTICRTITGIPAADNPYVPPMHDGEQPDEQRLDVIRRAVDSIALRR